MNRKLVATAQGEEKQVTFAADGLLSCILWGNYARQIVEWITFPIFIMRITRNGWNMASSGWLHNHRIGSYDTIYEIVAGVEAVNTYHTAALNSEKYSLHDVPPEYTARYYNNNQVS